jgi:hypothetical protein
VGVGEGAVQASSGGEGKQSVRCRTTFIAGKAARWQCEHGKVIVQGKGKQVVTIIHTWIGRDRAQSKSTRRGGEPERNAYGTCENVFRVFDCIVYVLESESGVYLQRKNAEWTIKKSESRFECAEEVGVFFSLMCDVR